MDKYQAEATQLSAVIKIAIQAFKTYPPPGFNQATLEHVINIHKTWEEKFLNPLPKFRNMKSLEYEKQSVLTYFQEGKGEAVSFLWKEVANQKLNIKRVNRLEKILKKNSISKRIDYEYAIDMIVPAQQEGLITSGQATILSNLIGDYEKKKKLE